MDRSRILVAVVLFFLGVMMAVQIRSARDIQPNSPVARVQELTARLKEVRQERDNLKDEVEDLRKKLDQISAGTKTADQALRDQLEKARVEAGLLPVTGPGVEIILNDNPKEIQPGEDPNLYILHEEDLLKVVNELRAGGAEAISINGERLLATSEIRCAGNTILVNTRKIAPPVVILATGDPDTLQSGLEIRGGIFQQLKFWGLVAEVRKKDNITVPAYTGTLIFNYSRPVK